MTMHKDTAEFGLLGLLINYLNAVERAVRAGSPVNDYERAVNESLPVEINRKRQVFRDGQTFIQRKEKQ